MHTRPSGYTANALGERERERKFGIVHTHAPFGWKIGGSNRMVGGSKGYVGAFVSDCDVHTK